MVTVAAAMVAATQVEDSKYKFATFLARHKQGLDQAAMEDVVAKPPPVQCCLCGWSLRVCACQCSLGAAVVGGATKHLLMLSLFCSWWWATFTAHALPLPLLPGYRSPCRVETASSDPVCSACRTLGHVDALCICERAQCPSLLFRTRF